MNLESDKRLIQLRLDFLSAQRGEARQAGREDIESLSVVKEPERPANTNRRRLDAGQKGPAAARSELFQEVSPVVSPRNRPFCDCPHAMSERLLTLLTGSARDVTRSGQVGRTSGHLRPLGRAAQPGCPCAMPAVRPSILPAWANRPQATARALPTLDRF